MSSSSEDEGASSSQEEGLTAEESLATAREHERARSRIVAVAVDRRARQAVGHASDAYLPQLRVEARHVLAPEDDDSISNTECRESKKRWS